MEMDARLIAQALNYHGQQLQKVWEGERNENELAMLNLKEPSFEIYQQRKRTLRLDFNLNFYLVFLGGTIFWFCFFLFLKTDTFLITKV